MMLRVLSSFTEQQKGVDVGIWTKYLRVDVGIWTRYTIYPFNEVVEVVHVLIGCCWYQVASGDDVVWTCMCGCQGDWGHLSMGRVELDMV